MDSNLPEKPALTDAAKAAVSGLGFIPILYPSNPSHDNDVQELQKKAHTVVENIEQLIGSGKLEDCNLQKLNTALARLRGALQGSGISREALAIALSEATAAMNAADATDKPITLQHKLDQLWAKIGQYNRDIDYDFENMRKAGIIFDEKLWSRHKHLSEYLQEHPQDIRKQKELISVDDLLLQQAEPQMEKCPKAQAKFDDAKAKSKDRHKDVATAAALQAAVEQDLDLASTGLFSQQGEKVTMDDVTSSIGNKPMAEQGNVARPRN